MVNGGVVIWAHDGQTGPPWLLIIKTETPPGPPMFNVLLCKLFGGWLYGNCSLVLYIYRCTLCQGQGNCVGFILSFQGSISNAICETGRSSWWWRHLPTAQRGAGAYLKHFLTWHDSIWLNKIEMIGFCRPRWDQIACSCWCMRFPSVQANREMEQESLWLHPKRPEIYYLTYLTTSNSWFSSLHNCTAMFALFIVSIITIVLYRPTLNYFMPFICLVVWYILYIFSRPIVYFILVGILRTAKQHCFLLCMTINIYYLILSYPKASYKAAFSPTPTCQLSPEPSVRRWTIQW